MVLITINWRMFAILSMKTTGVIYEVTNSKYLHTKIHKDLPMIS